MRFSYSNISTFSQCPFRWKLQYLDKLKTIPETNADNALWLGLGLHKGIETGSAELGVAEYQSHFNILTDEIINYSMQLEYQIPRVIELLPKDGEHELKLETDEFVGYIDRLVYLFTDENGIKHYEIWDYKYSNNIERYLKSGQLHLYKYYFEQTHPNTVVDTLRYVFIPKINIRQKFKQNPPETIFEFRQRLQEHLEASEIKIVEVEYDNTTISQFLDCCQALKTVNEFPKNETKLCDWCQYKEYCKSNGEVDWMIM